MSKVQKANDKDAMPWCGSVEEEFFEVFGNLAVLG
jgi:hypothetical protein